MNVTKTALGKVSTISRLDGGLNKKGSVYEIKDNEAIGLINFIFTEYGILKKRPGYIKFNSTEISGATGIYGLFRFYKQDGSTKYFVCTTSTDIYYWNTTTELWAALTCDVTLTADQTFRFAVLNDLLFLTNGANKPLKWLGGSSNHVKELGIVAPAAGSAVAFGSGTGLTGVYYWKVTYYNPTTGELTESSASTGFPSGGKDFSGGNANKDADLSTIPRSTDDQVTKIRIYRTQADVLVYYYVDEIDNPTIGNTGSYTDGNSDATIGANATLISNVGSTDTSDHNPPPITAKYIATMKNRVFLYNVTESGGTSYPTRLWWSETNEPEYFPPANYRVIPPDAHGAIGTGVLAWGDNLYIFNENGTYALTDPSDPGESTLREVSPEIGLISPDSLQVGQFQRPTGEGKGDYILTQGIVLHTRYGTMGFDGQTFWPLSERVEPILESLYETNLTKAVGFFNNNKYYFSYTRKQGTPTEGAFVSFSQQTTDTGDENKDATYDEDHDADNFQSGTDARIDLTHTTADNENIIVTTYIPWSEVIYYGYESPFYEIFFSYDSGTTRTSKGVWQWTKNSQFENPPFYNTHTFFDSAVTNVYLDYFAYMKFSNRASHLVDYIRLEKVEYQYDYSYAVEGIQVNNNRILYYDTLHNAYSQLQGLKANCFCAWNSSGDKREEYFGSSTNGYVYLMNVGSEDDGNEIYALYQSKHYDCKDRARKKRFNSLSLSTDVYSNVIYLDVFVDRVQVATYEINLTPTGDNTTYWNEEYFGATVFDRVVNLISKSLRLPANALGRFISIRLWTSSKEDLTVKDWSVRFVERDGFR